MTDIRRYRPSNGTEADCFMARFCEKCSRANMDDDSPEPPCIILGRALGYSIGDPEYPDEWQYKEVADGYTPVCTAFTTEEKPEELYRCENTIDMFGG